MKKVNLLMMKATFNGEEDLIESPVACNKQMITRAPLHCGATLDAAQALIAPAVTSQLREESGTEGLR